MIINKWDKPSEELTKLLETMLHPFNCTSRKMFGSITYFVNNNMFAGVFEDTIFLRLSNEDQDQLRREEIDVFQFEPLEGRKMREYMVLCESIIHDIPKFEKWLERSFEYAKSLPIKNKK